MLSKMYRISKANDLSGDYNVRDTLIKNNNSCFLSGYSHNSEYSPCSHESQSSSDRHTDSRSHRPTQLYGYNAIELVRYPSERTCPSNLMLSPRSIFCRSMRLPRAYHWEDFCHQKQPKAEPEAEQDQGGFGLETVESLKNHQYFQFHFTQSQLGLL